MFKLWDAYFGVAKGNLLRLLGILDSTIAKALVSPIHYPEVHMMCLLTLSHLLTLRQNVSGSVIILLGCHLWYSWYTAENSCWPICNYPMTESAAVVGICVQETMEDDVPKAWVSPWTHARFWVDRQMGRRAINLDNAQHCWRARAL